MKEITGNVVVTVVNIYKNSKMDSHLTEEYIQDVENHEERKLCREKSQEPLGCVHVSLKAKIHEMIEQIGQILLRSKINKKI